MGAQRPDQNGSQQIVDVTLAQLVLFVMPSCCKFADNTASCVEFAAGLLLVGPAVRDDNVGRVPCHIGKLDRILGTQHMPLQDSCTLLQSFSVELQITGRRMLAK